MSKDERDSLMQCFSQKNWKLRDLQSKILLFFASNCKFTTFLFNHQQIVNGHWCHQIFLKVKCVWLFVQRPKDQWKIVWNHDRNVIVEFTSQLTTCQQGLQPWIIFTSSFCQTSVHNMKQFKQCSNKVSWQWCWHLKQPHWDPDNVFCSLLTFCELTHGCIHNWSPCVPWHLKHTEQGWGLPIVREQLVTCKLEAFRVFCDKLLGHTHVDWTSCNSFRCCSCKCCQVHHHLLSMVEGWICNVFFLMFIFDLNFLLSSPFLWQCDKCQRDDFFASHQPIDLSGLVEAKLDKVHIPLATKSHAPIHSGASCTGLCFLMWSGVFELSLFWFGKKIERLQLFLSHSVVPKQFDLGEERTFKNATLNLRTARLLPNKEQEFENPTMKWSNVMRMLSLWSTGRFVEKVCAPNLWALQHRTAV